MISVRLEGQHNPYRIKNGVQEIELWKNYEFLIDSTSSMKIDDVLAAENWTEAEKIKNFGFTDVSVWTRYKISYDRDSINSARLYLVSQTVTMDTIEFYSFSDGSLIKQMICGDHIDYDTRDAEHQACAFEIPENYHDQTIYLRFRTTGPLTLPVTIKDGHFLQKTSFFETYFYGVHLGIFLVVGLYHLILFVFLREKTLLLYAVYVLAAGFTGTIINGLTPQLMFRSDPGIVDGFPVFFANFSLIFYLWFIVEFLQVKIKTRWIYFIMMFVIVLSAILLTLSFAVSPAQLSAPTVLTGISSHFFVFVVTVYYVIKRYRDTLFVMIASSFFVITGFIFSLRMLGLIPVSFVTENGIEIGSALEVILISISLGSRFRRTVVEKNALYALGKFKEVMTGMLAHDLKNPLSIILNQESGNHNSKQMASQMLNLVNNMLDVHKFESTEVKLKLDKVNVQELFVEAVEQIRPLLSSKNIELKNNVNADAGIFADKEILRRVLVNLLTNAIKYSSMNSRIELSATLINTKMKISVQDFGKGIAEDEIAGLFEAFEQIDPRSSGGVASTGLGLTFCKLAIEAHHSMIQVSTKEGQGTTFFFSLEKVPDYIRQGKISGVIDEDYTLSITPEIIKSAIDSLPELRNLKVYQVSEIEELIDQIPKEKREELQVWIDELLNAAYSNNQEHFERLLAV